MINLGQVPAPGGEPARLDLPAAKQIIDILGVLEKKTEGNLDNSEQKLLNGLICELRIKFVNASQQAASDSSLTDNE